MFRRRELARARAPPPGCDAVALARRLLDGAGMKITSRLVLFCSLVTACSSGPRTDARRAPITGLVDVDPLGVGIVYVGVYQPDAHQSWWCGGTLVRNDTVMTSRGCLQDATPAQVTVELDDTRSGTWQTAGAVELLSNDWTDVMLVTLSSPLSIGGSASGYARPDPQALPANGDWIECYGFGSDRFGDVGALHGRLFQVASRGWNVIDVDDPDGALLPGDLGGPCFLSSATADDVYSPIVGTLSSLGSTASLGNPDLVNTWVDGMIASRPLRASASPFELVNQASMECLDIPDGDYFPFIHIQQYTCHGGSNQLWYASGDVVQGSFSIVSARTGLCLEAAYNVDENPTHYLWQNVCDGQPHQQFRRAPLPTVHGYVIQPQNASNYCLDDPAGTAAVGEGIQWYPCNWGANQAWSFAAP